MSSVLEFIEVFQSPSNQKLFTHTACYWFAKILCERFRDESSLVYNPHKVHFATKINSNVYDINGIADDSEDYIEWEEYASEYEDAEMILHDCMTLESKVKTEVQSSSGTLVELQ